MAKKTTKLTREQSYRAILATEGTKLEECRVLGFTFESERRPECFHYDLMLHDPRPTYYIFDCWEKNANVVVPDDDANAGVIIAIAERDGGKKTMANLG